MTKYTSCGYTQTLSHDSDLRASRVTDLTMTSSTGPTSPPMRCNSSTMNRDTFCTFFRVVQRRDITSWSQKAEYMMVAEHSPLFLPPPPPPSQDTVTYPVFGSRDDDLTFRQQFEVCCDIAWAYDHQQRRLFSPCCYLSAWSQAQIADQGVSSNPGTSLRPRPSHELMRRNVASDDSV